MNIRETEVAACIPVRELFVIESEQVEDRRVEIVNVNGVLLRLETELVRRAVGGAAFRAAAREPDGEAPLIVVAAGRRGELRRGRSSELARPEDERVFEHPALLEIGEERRDRLVAFQREPSVVLRDLVVVVPRLTGARPDLDEPYSALEEPPRHEHLPPLRA